MTASARSCRTFSTPSRFPGRAGVAAPQIGVGLRAFSYNIDGDIGYILNPEIVELAGDAEPTGEGCLSVPGLWHDALRHPYAKVVGIDLDGEEVVLEGDGLFAQALQHETDHLDGMLYIQRLSPEDRKAAMREIREKRLVLKIEKARGDRPGPFDRRVEPISRRATRSSSTQARCRGRRSRSRSHRG